MPGNKRGYSMPYAVRRNYRLVVPLMWLFMAAVCVVSVLPGCQGIVRLENTKLMALRITTVLVIPMVIPFVAAYFAQLHLVPEGIAVTLFGMTVRRISAEEIRFLGALRYRHKSSTTDLIAVSTCSYEELQDLGLQRTPEILRDATESWEGKWAAKYLLRHAGEFFREWNLRRWLLWLDWDPERLRAMRKLYPQAQWMDLTKDKLFDAQL